MIRTIQNPAPRSRTGIALTVERVSAVIPHCDEIEIGSIVIRYLPTKRCIEVYSLSNFMAEIRGKGMTRAELCQAVTDAIQEACGPEDLAVEFVAQEPAGEHITL